MTESRSLTVGIVLPDARILALFRRALESIAAQSHADWRLVVTDAFETPGEAARIAGLVLGRDDPRVTFQPVGDASRAAAINLGLRALETELAVIHPEGDSWSPEFLSVMVERLAATRRRVPGLKAAVSGASSVSEEVTGAHIRIDAVTDWAAPGSAEPCDGVLDIRRIALANPFPAIAFLFDRNAALDLGGYDETLPLHADWDFHLRFCLEHDLWTHAERLAFHHERAEDAALPEDAAYRAVLTNRWLRRTGDMCLLQAPDEAGAPVPAGKPEVKAGAPVAQPLEADPAKRRKGPFGRALSNLNRARKRWI